MEVVLKIMEVLEPSREYIGRGITSYLYWENAVTGEKKQANMYGKPGWVAVTEDYFFNNPAGAKVGADHQGLVIPVGVLRDPSVHFKTTLAQIRDTDGIEGAPHMKVNALKISLDPQRIEAMEWLGPTDEELTPYQDIFN